MTTTGMGIAVRIAHPAEREAVEAFARQFPAIRDFVYTWERWGNWHNVRNRPVVALYGPRIVGVHAATLARRNPYLNSYYLATDPIVRGQGIGGEMISRSLVDAHRNRLTRLKMKCHLDSPGRAFWEGFGCRAFAEDDVQLWYNHDIRGAIVAAQLPEWMARWSEHEPVPAGAVEAAKKAGARIRLGSSGYAGL